MPTKQASAGYDRAGTWHEVLVTRDPAGRWQVIDATGSQVTLVETLSGHDDRLRLSLDPPILAANQRRMHGHPPIA